MPVSPPILWSGTWREGFCRHRSGWTDGRIGRSRLLQQCQGRGFCFPNPAFQAQIALLGGEGADGVCRIWPSTRTLPPAMHSRATTHGAVWIRRWLMIKLIERVWEVHVVPGRLVGGGGGGIHAGWKMGAWGGKGETGRFHPKTQLGWSPAPGEGDCRMGPG